MGDEDARLISSTTGSESLEMTYFIVATATILVKDCYLRSGNVVTLLVSLFSFSPYVSPPCTL